MAGCGGRADMPGFGRDSGFLVDRYLARPVSLRAALLVPQEQRPAVVDPEDPAVPLAPALGERHLAPAQDIVLVPELRKRVLVLALDEALVGEEHAADQRRGQAVKV